MGTASEPKRAKHGPLNKNLKNQLVRNHFLGNTPGKQQERSTLKKTELAGPLLPCTASMG